MLSAGGKVGCAAAVAFEVVVCERTKRPRLALVVLGAGVGENQHELFLMVLICLFDHMVRWCLAMFSG